jgi:hypothetical protein
MNVTIYKGNPTSEDWKKIGEMINEGYHTGIDVPYGINWEKDVVKSKKKKMRKVV